MLKLNQKAAMEISAVSAAASRFTYCFNAAFCSAGCEVVHDLTYEQHLKPSLRQHQHHIFLLYFFCQLELVTALLQVGRCCTWQNNAVDTVLWKCNVLCALQLVTSKIARSKQCNTVDDS